MASVVGASEAPSTPPHLSRVDNNGDSHRLVSFALYGAKRLYVRGALANAKLVPQVYGEKWAARFYVADVPEVVVDELCSLGSQVIRYMNFQEPAAGMLLRFLPAGDPALEAVVVRDADSRVNQREAAAVADWLGSAAPFHIMHESDHNGDYGPIMGGMWGARPAAASGLADALMLFLERRASNGGLAYGDDMTFLSEFIFPRLTARNTVHHVGGDVRRTIGGLQADTIPRRPMVGSPYRGFVGGPVNCGCTEVPFLTTGCDHVNRAVPAAIASNLMSEPDVMAALGQFIGDAGLKEGGGGGGGGGAWGGVAAPRTTAPSPLPLKRSAPGAATGQ